MKLHIDSFSCEKIQKAGEHMVRTTKSITTRTGNISKNDIDRKLECEGQYDVEVFVG